jgi:hypothetical protein
LDAIKCLMLSKPWDEGVAISSLISWHGDMHCRRRVVVKFLRVFAIKNRGSSLIWRIVPS